MVMCVCKPNDSLIKRPGFVMVSFVDRNSVAVTFMLLSSIE